MQQNSKRRRIGLFGGSFNPPQEGHLMVAELSRAALGLDEVWLLVTPCNPLKNPGEYEPLHHRLELCRLMAGGRAWLRAMDVETQAGSSHTVDFLKYIAENNPETDLIWIMGSDGLQELHLWNGWREIIDNRPIAVLSRAGSSETALQSPAALYAAHLKTDDLKNLGRGGRPGWCFIGTDNLPTLGSRRIIEKMRRQGGGLKSLFNALSETAHRPEFEDIARYILRHNLYGLRAKPQNPAPE